MGMDRVVSIGAVMFRIEDMMGGRVAGAVEVDAPERSIGACKN